MTPRVSVIIPAYNAAATLDETLCSARGQSLTDIEIIVVDDGSRDRTGDIARNHAASDARVRVLSQPNRGVATARNAGIAESAGEFLAFLDADDLWAAAKLERQLAAMEAAGPDAGASYTLYCCVDPDGRLSPGHPQARAVPDALGALCRSNFIGNTSSILVRRDLAQRVGGFDPQLQAQGAQGCEDWDFFLRLANVTRLVTVPEPLTAYRVGAGNMSSDDARMLRSARLMAEKLAGRMPTRRAELAQGVSNYAFWLAMEALKRRDLSAAARLFIAHGRGRLRLLRPLLRRIEAQVFPSARVPLVAPPDPASFHSPAPLP